MPRSARAGHDCGRAQVGNDRHWHSSRSLAGRGAHSIHVPPAFAPLLGVPVPSPLFSEYLACGFVFQHRFGQKLLKPSILALECLQPFRIGHTHAAKLAAPKLVARLRETVPPARFLDWQTAVRLPQETNDLFFRESLFHVQSSLWLGLDSNVRCYSRWGDVVLTNH